MIDAIVYNSNTGFTKQYAYSFAVKIGVPIYSLKESKKLKHGSKIIFFTWIRADKLVGLKAVKKYELIKVCAVGLRSYSEELIDKLKEINNLSEIYYLKGGIRMYKLNLLYRSLINMIAKSLKKKEKKNIITQEEKDLLDSINNNFEYIDLGSLDILISWYMNNNSYVC
ncbi:MAG: hypothetical protein IJA65_02670 [Acholeplasmatales bacterium]|nr:hypothetical protein [Acholeplasmatales bacterium]